LPIESRDGALGEGINLSDALAGQIGNTPMKMKAKLLDKCFVIRRQSIINETLPEGE
jgi:hypothetical protein